jgi:hypothetical protein
MAAEHNSPCFDGYLKDFLVTSVIAVLANNQVRQRWNAQS